MILETKTRNSEPKKIKRIAAVAFAVFLVFAGSLAYGVRPAQGATADTGNTDPTNSIDPRVSVTSVLITPATAGRSYNTYSLQVSVDGIVGGAHDTAGNIQYAFGWFFMDANNNPTYIPPAADSTELEKIILSHGGDVYRAIVTINLPSANTYNISAKGFDPASNTAIARTGFSAPISITGGQVSTGTLTNKLTLTTEFVGYNAPGGAAGAGSTAPSTLKITGLLDGVEIDPSTCGCTLNWFTYTSASDTSGTAVPNMDNQNGFITGQGKGIVKLVYGKGAQGSLEASVDTGAPADKSTVVGSSISAPVDLFLSALEKIVQFIVFLLTTLLYTIVRVVFTPLIVTMLTLAPHQAGFAAVILPVWVFVRNVVNILFILALVALGVATLLRIDQEHFNYKHLIPELVLMALLVNFSLVIAQLILGVADTVQAQFLPNNSEVINNLARQLLIAPNINTFNAEIFQTASQTFGSIISSVVYLLFAIGAAVAFGLIAGFLMIRTVALWFLLLLSPVAYAANVLPWTHHFAQEWWSNFLKYAFFTPVLAFFLHICAVLAVAQSDYVKAITQTSIQQAVVGSFATFIYMALSSALLIICLIAGVHIAEEFGIKGASTLIGVAEKGLHFGAHRVGASLAAWKNVNVTEPLSQQGIRSTGAKGVFFRTLARLSAPVSGWQARSERVHHEQQKIQQRIAGQMITGSYFGASGGHADLQKDVIAEQRNINEYVPGYKTLDTQGHEEQFEALFHDQSDKALEEKSALMVSAFETGRIGDMMDTIVKAHGFGKGANKGKLNGNSYREAMDAFLGDSSRARLIKSQILSQMAKDKNYFWAIYPGAPDGKGGFISGTTEATISPETSKELGMAEFEIDQDGNRIKKYDSTRGEVEEAVRAVQTRNPDDLLHDPESYRMTYMYNSKDSNDRSMGNHFHPTYLRTLGRFNEASRDKLLQVSTQFYKRALGLTGVDKATGGFIFESDEAREAFKNDILDKDGNVKTQYENLVGMAFAKYGGIARQLEARAHSVVFMDKVTRDGKDYLEPVVAGLAGTPKDKIGKARASIKALPNSAVIELPSRPAGMADDEEYELYKLAELRRRDKIGAPGSLGSGVQAKWEGLNIQDTQQKDAKRK